MVSAVGFATGAIAAGAAILRFEADNALQNGPSYIKDGVPTSAPAQIGQAIARQACRRYADGSDSILDEDAVNFETVCRPYLDNIGYGAGPSLKRQFDGGQCAGVLYNVTVVATATRERCPNSNGDESPLPSRSVSGVLRGPVSGFSFETVTEGQCGPVSSNIVATWGNPDGTVSKKVFASGFSSGRSDVSLTGQTISSVTISRQDGQPDNCGNPEPTLEPIEGPVVPGPDTEPFNPGPDIDINIGVEIRPDSLIEVNLGFGPVIIAPFGGGDGGSGGGEAGSGAPGVPEAGPEVAGGNGGFGGDDSFGADPAGRRWAGACIRITGKPPNAGVIVTSIPEDVYPSVIGNARLVYDAFGSRVVDTPVQIRAQGTCLWEPIRGMNPVAVNVDLLPGYTYAYTPYSVPVDN